MHTLTLSAQALHTWLQMNGVDPNKVLVVLRATNPETRLRIEASIRADWNDMCLRRASAEKTPDDIKGFILHGVRFRLADLDASRTDIKP